MAKISIDMVRHCYDAALGMDRGDLSPGAAVDAAVAASGIRHGSALDYVYNIQHLLHGQSYKRTMNEAATEAILNWIAADRGPAVATKAAQAVLAHADYYAGLPKGGNLVGIRRIAQTVLDKPKPEPAPVFLAQFDAAVKQSMQDTHAARAARLASADPMPGKTCVTSDVFIRIPDVVATVLLRAKGACEHCQRPAPFRKRSDGSPYLEVHHRVPLAENGSDTVENALALCPNCHREAHLGENWKDFRP